MKKYPGGAAIQAFSADAISFSTGAASVIVIATNNTSLTLKLHFLNNMIS